MPVVADPVPAPRAGSTLFTEAPPTNTAPQRPSMFNLFTARRRATEHELPRAEPTMAAEREPTALVRQTAGEPEATGLDIPAFLRRQSN
jgi:hypothetical protein